jgi:hypothetical protein
MTTDLEVTEVARLVQKALTDLGFAYTTKEGDLVEVAYRRLARAADRYLILEVDTNRLPPRVAIPRMETPDVLSHLSAVVGRPVTKLNTVGLTYVVVLQPPPKPKPLPNRVELPDRPPPGLTYAWPFGVDREGREVWADLQRTGHILVGGKPGAGKSTFVNAGLVALLREHTPASLTLTLTDPKAVELWPYAGLPHLALPVATSPDDAAGVVAWLVAEVGRREALFKATGAKRLEAYNTLAAEPLPLVLAVFDEVTDLVLTWGGPKTPAFAELTRVSSKGRAFGVVLLLATQNPKADILDTLVRENSGVRVGLKVDTAQHAKTILGRNGAEDLPTGRPGRLAVVGLAGADLVVLQGFAVEDPTVIGLVARLRAEEPSPLLPLEADLVVFARDHLGGAFTLQALYDAFRGRISWRRLAALGRSWEARRWLTSPADAVSPRLLTAELLHLVEGLHPPA